MIVWEASPFDAASLLKPILIEINVYSQKQLNVFN